jgi:4-diphosphocytidyl-2-C-methyl-D-erythritol kinase
MTSSRATNAIAEPAALVEHARAKVNLTLRVVGRRVDGYHDLESVVAFAECADRLTLSPGPQLQLEVTGPFAKACGELSDNLVLKATRLLGERVAGLKVGRFTLDKVLPVAAGIGGGSADAAAALRLLARTNGLSIEDPRLIEVTRLAGADVPVCLASRACVMTGIGETLAPLGLPKLPCVLVNPRVAVATKQVFESLGLRSGELRVGVNDVIEALTWPADGASSRDWIGALASGTNDLESPAIKVQPVIDEVLSALRAAAGARVVRMSGSGATCFAIFDDAATAQAASEMLEATHPQWWVHAGALS